MPWGCWRVHCNRRLHDFIFQNFPFFSEKSGEVSKKGKWRERKWNFMFHFAIRIYFPVSLMQPRDVIKWSGGTLRITSNIGTWCGRFEIRGTPSASARKQNFISFLAIWLMREVEEQNCKLLDWSHRGVARILHKNFKEIPRITSNIWAEVLVCHPTTQLSSGY